MQRFAKRIQEFLAEEYSKLEEESFLSYEDFQEALENEKLLASLLFNSGEGYFAYCVLDSHSPQKDLGTPIDAQNATAEVEKYLNKREEQEKAAPRRKILLVDDSLMIRQGMEKLLGKDYEIFQAESGVAALNILRINRPDLVLLDYDMPICNGKQTLELIRSQKDFLDIPVIFLTGRDDAETVNNVLALKPTGYMLKSLKQSDIKNRIDTFFEKKN